MEGLGHKLRPRGFCTDVLTTDSQPVRIAKRALKEYTPRLWVRKVRDEDLPFYFYVSLLSSIFNKNVLSSCFQNYHTIKLALFRCMILWIIVHVWIHGTNSTTGIQDSAVTPKKLPLTLTSQLHTLPTPNTWQALIYSPLLRFLTPWECHAIHSLLRSTSFTQHNACEIYSSSWMHQYVPFYHWIVFHHIDTAVCLSICPLTHI